MSAGALIGSIIGAIACQAIAVSYRLHPKVIADS